MNYLLLVPAFGIVYIVGYLVGELAGWLGISDDCFNDLR